MFPSQLTIQRVLETADLLLRRSRSGPGARRFGLGDGGFQLRYARVAQLDRELRHQCTQSVSTSLPGKLNTGIAWRMVLRFAEVSSALR